MQTNRICLVAILLLAGPAFAQMPQQATEPASPHATAVSATEIKAAVARNPAGAFSDNVLAVAAIDASPNVGVAVVRRSQVNGQTPPDAIVHDAVTEVYQIIEGRGILVTGGTLQSAVPLAAYNPVVGEIGPSSVGKSIVGGTRQPVGPGDIVVIPPHTPHGFVEISTKRIVYTLIRIDPQKLLKPLANSH